MGQTSPGYTHFPVAALIKSVIITQASMCLCVCPWLRKMSLLLLIGYVIIQVSMLCVSASDNYMSTYLVLITPDVLKSMLTLEIMIISDLSDL